MSCQGKCRTAFICECKCFRECDCDYDNECTCEHLDNCLYISDPKHKECIVYCKYQPACCELTKCNNYFMCSNEIPEYVYKRNNNLCDGCYIQFGKLENIEKIEECCVCLNEKYMIKLECNHSICSECLEKWFCINDCRTCPLCRHEN